MGFTFALLFLLHHAGDTTATGPKCYGPNPDAGSSAAVRVEDVAQAHTAQLLPTDDTGRIVGKGKLDVQIGQLFENLGATLRRAGSATDRVVKVNAYVTHPGAVAAFDRALARSFKGPNRPAVTIVTTSLPHPDALVALDAVAVSTEKAITRRRGVSVLPAGTRIYVSGQAEKGKDLAEATRRTLASLDSTLKYLGRGRKDVVHAKAFLTPMTNGEAARKEMSAFFGTTAPPFAFVEWESGLPIEIELIVAGGESRAGAAIEYLTPPGMTASPIYSRVARINHGPTVYLGGQYGPVGGTAAAEVEGAFGAMGKILKEAGSDWRHLAKATYYVSTDAVSQQLNLLRPNYYDPRRPPAASKAKVGGVGRRGNWTFDLIAVPAAKVGG